LVEQLLLALKIGFVVLLYLFIWRVIRVASRDITVGQESVIIAPVRPARHSPERPAGRLVVTRSPELPEGSSITLSHELVAGRERGIDIALPADGYASGRHARFMRGLDLDTVEDMRSTNGTFLNGQRLSGVQALAPGDVITIGQTQLTYEPGG
jgi:FHA domain